MSDDDPEASFKPQNVTEEAAEGYLIATGWLKDTIITAADDPKKWFPPSNTAGKKFTRGQAVMKQFKSDVSRFIFVLNHAHPDLLMLFIPPHVIAKLQALMSEGKPKPPVN